MQAHTYPELSGREQWQLLWWMVRHPAALDEDTAVPHYRVRRLAPDARRLSPRAWLTVHVVAGMVVALAVARHLRARPDLRAR